MDTTGFKKKGVKKKKKRARKLKKNPEIREIVKATLTTKIASLQQKVNRRLQLELCLRNEVESYQALIDLEVKETDACIRVLQNVIDEAEMVLDMQKINYTKWVLDRDAKIAREQEELLELKRDCLKKSEIQKEQSKELKKTLDSLKLFRSQKEELQARLDNMRVQIVQQGESYKEEIEQIEMELKDSIRRTREQFHYRVDDAARELWEDVMRSNPLIRDIVNECLNTRAQHEDIKTKVLALIDQNRTILGRVLILRQTVKFQGSSIKNLLTKVRHNEDLIRCLFQQLSFVRHSEDSMSKLEAELEAVEDQRKHVEHRMDESRKSIATLNDSYLDLNKKTLAVDFDPIYGIYRELIEKVERAKDFISKDLLQSLDSTKHSELNQKSLIPRFLVLLDIAEIVGDDDPRSPLELGINTGRESIIDFSRKRIEEYVRRQAYGIGSLGLIYNGRKRN